MKLLWVGAGRVVQSLGKPVCVLAVACALLAAAPAAAQSFIRADCRSIAVKAGAPRYDDDLHALWYQRFWTGSCGRLEFCQPGEPSWNRIVTTIERKAPAAGRSVAHDRVCRLGRLIGFEWARDNGVRRIDTAALVRYSTMLLEASEPISALDRIERDVRTRLGLK